MNYLTPVATTLGRSILILFFGKTLTIACFEAPMSVSTRTSPSINTLFLQRGTSYYSLSMIPFSLHPYHPNPSHQHVSPGFMNWPPNWTPCFHLCPLSIYSLQSSWKDHITSLFKTFQWLIISLWVKVKFLTKRPCITAWSAYPSFLFFPLFPHSLTTPQIC